MVSRLQNLKDVFISDCPDMEVIISKKEEEEGDEGAEPNDLILFPRLRNLELLDSKFLRQFWELRLTTIIQSPGMNVLTLFMNYIYGKALFLIVD